MFTWTQEQLRQVGPGCTLVYVDPNGERVQAEVAGVERVCGELWIDMRGGLGNDCESHFDPSTLRAPTLATLNRMAVESFGEGAEILQNDADHTIAVLAVRPVYGQCLVAQFYAEDDGGDAARECARWLAARGR